MEDPLDIAAEVLRQDRSTLASPERLKHGLTNESWLVRANDTAVVVRLSNRDAEALQIDQGSEANVLAAVAHAGIGAPVVLCAPERHLLVTRHLSGRTWTSRDARLPRNVVRIATLLRQLHAMPIPDDVQTTDLRRVVSGYWNTLLSRGLSARAGSQETRARASELIAQLYSDAQSCLCHNDVHHLNVIDDGQLRLLDWEYAGIGDPYFDLAAVSVYHVYSDELRGELLRAYLGHDHAASLERLHRMCWVFNYIRELWFAVREMA